MRYIFIILIISNVLGQTNTISPFSAFGVGELMPEGQSRSFSMGGVGNSLLHPLRVNKINPASYSYLRSTTMDFSFALKNINLKTPDTKAVYPSGGINDMTFAFPSPYKPFAIAFGASPYSSVGYEIEYKDVLWEDTIPHNVEYYRKGNGGLNNVFLVLAYNIHKRLFLGAEGNFLFGNIQEEWRNAIDRSTNVAYFAGFIQQNRISGFAYKIGTIYLDTLKDQTLFSVGINIYKSFGLKNNATFYKYERRDLYSYLQDTTGNYSNTLELPLKIGLGLTVSNFKKFTLGLDFNYQDWSNVSLLRNEAMTKLYNIKLGGEYIPNINSVKYWGRIRLRAGAFYTKEPIQIKNNDVNSFGFTAGVGFPVLRSLSQVSLGFSYKHKYINNDNSLQENTYIAFIGVSFNEVWFLKRKID